MEKIEITGAIIKKITEAEFHKQTNGKKVFNLQSKFIQNEWIKEASEMLENYNRVVEIMGDLL